jgi:hypothetical protein
VEGSRISDPIRYLLIALLGGAGALALAVPGRAAEMTAAPGAIGQPIVLFSPSMPSPVPLVRSAAATTAAPAKRPAVAVQRIPLDAKPLIPPAPLPAKLGPPPDPRPALPLETDLQPLTPPSQASNPQAPPAGPTPPPAGKSPAG